MNQRDMKTAPAETVHPRLLETVRESIRARHYSPRTGAIRRHHVYENYLIRGVKDAARAAGIAEHVSCHTLRHSFATHLL